MEIYQPHKSSYFILQTENIPYPWLLEYLSIKQKFKQTPHSLHLLLSYH